MLMKKYVKIILKLIKIYIEVKQQAENKRIRETLLEPVYTAVVDYMNEIMLICSSSNDELKAQMKSYEDWCLVFKSIFWEKEYREAYVVILKEKIDNLDNVTEGILDRKEIYIRLGLISKNTIDYITRIKEALYIPKFMFSDINNVGRTVIGNNEKIKKLLLDGELKRVAGKRYGYDKHLHWN